MIGYLKGQLLKIAPSKVLIDVGGVGYEVSIPLATYYELEPKATGDTVELHVHTHVREDALVLFGFGSEIERRLFEKLIAISGIGPRLALAVLATPPPDLVAALQAGDVKGLSRIPGIGKKTAERMVVELRDKVDDLAAEMPSPAAPVAADSDLVGALVGLGYKAAAAEQAVERVTRENPDAAFADLLRLSLKQLSRV